MCIPPFPIKPGQGQSRLVKPTELQASAPSNLRNNLRLWNLRAFHGFSRQCPSNWVKPGQTSLTNRPNTRSEGKSQRPPAKPEACRRRSGSKPHGPSGMAWHKRLSGRFFSLAPSRPKAGSGERAGERGISPESESFPLHGSIRASFPRPSPPSRRGGRREGGAAAGTVRLLESAGNAGGFPVGLRNPAKHLPNGLRNRGTTTGAPELEEKDARSESCAHSRPAFGGCVKMRPSTTFSKNIR